mgnify:CR=1 FL=1
MSKTKIVMGAITATGVLGVIFGGAALIDRMSPSPILSFNQKNESSSDPVSEMRARGQVERQLRCGDKRTGTVSYPKRMGGQDATATMHCDTGSISFVYPK